MVGGRPAVAADGKPTRPTTRPPQPRVSETLEPVPMCHRLLWSLCEYSCGGRGRLLNCAIVVGCTSGPTFAMKDRRPSPYSCASSAANGLSAYWPPLIGNEAGSVCPAMKLLPLQCGMPRPPALPAVGL